MAEPHVSQRQAGQRLGAPDRSQVASEQEQALPSGDVVVSCSAPLGAGGLGRHLQEIMDALARRHAHGLCICEGSGTAQLPARRRPLAPTFATALAPLARFSPTWRMWMVSVEFDGHAARRLPAADHLIAFNGTARMQFASARAAGYESVGLVSATSHLRRVIRQYARAYDQYPLERPWTARLLARNLAEYAAAQRIYVSTRHIWESFVEEGVAEDKLAHFPLTPDPRYRPAGAGAIADTFDVVYVGSLSVAKGVPLLVDAVRRLPHADLRLVLVGGWGSRGMRRFMQRACAQDRRVTVRLGDPLEHLRAARLYVHASYEDGFAYAPAEALACGVPLLVSEGTGMKELIDSPRHGVVLPTGELDALSEAIDAAYRGELFGG